MFQPPEHSHNLSMWLSEVLQDIGVTETMVVKKSRMWMINEAINSTETLILDKKATLHYFGSQPEASTTQGLASDIDQLGYFHEVQVIQDWSQWQPDIKWQYLMVQDETVSPGYCLLQLLRPDAPLPELVVQHEDHSTDSKGRVLLRHSMCLELLEGATLHGPAQSCSPPDTDTVVGICCSSWPKEAIPWLQQQTNSGWPTEHMKRYSADQGCFVVPVGSKEGLYQDLEWRISTSLAERCMMFNINITQIRCYILMKMVIKTFLKPVCGEAVSSFMCKNVLFHCIAGSEVNSEWNEGCLVLRLNQCLQALLHCILTENCSHFVIPRNNLLAGKLSAEVKRQLSGDMCKITGNIEQTLLGIQIDDLGHRLYEKLGGISTVYLGSADHSALIIAQEAIHSTSEILLTTIKHLQRNLPQNAHSLMNSVSKVVKFYREGSDCEKVAVSLLTPFICSTIGSIIASADIQHSPNISPDAVKWFSLGLNSDVSSSKLKLASALYCACELQSSEMVLDVVHGVYIQMTLIVLFFLGVFDMSLVFIAV